MKRHAMTVLAAFGVVLVLMLGGCSGAKPSTGDRTPSPSPDATSTGDAAGLRVANGLYDQPDGTVLVIGTLEWNDLEGGFWAIVGSPEATGDADKVIAVLPAIAQDDSAYMRLAGKTVQVTGVRSEGASIRNAGPEVKVTSISEITDTPGIAE